MTCSDGDVDNSHAVHSIHGSEIECTQKIFAEHVVERLAQQSSTPCGASVLALTSSSLSPGVNRTCTIIYIGHAMKVSGA